MLCSIPWPQGLGVIPCPQELHCLGRQDWAKFLPFLVPAPAANSAAVAGVIRRRLGLVADEYGVQMDGWHQLPSGRAIARGQALIRRYFPGRQFGFPVWDGLDRRGQRRLKQHSPLAASPALSRPWPVLALLPYH